ncbi:unnamed protein product [Clonostachys rosea]|uniref:Uncharacterized protein n=1 Tax=Bionectria ochroleuca TaxID=29856 RepID=A0ABY6U3V9_BIOOC|nr:unnamed protein product [Clonostachys rosea]
MNANRTHCTVPTYQYIPTEATGQKGTLAVVLALVIHHAAIHLLGAMPKQAPDRPTVISLYYSNATLARPETFSDQTWSAIVMPPPAPEDLLFMHIFLYRVGHMWESLFAVLQNPQNPRLSP